MFAELETARLLLRPWEARDRAAFAAINADARVMRYFDGPLSPGESDAIIDRQMARAAEDGVGFAAVERRVDGMFLGMVGISIVKIGGPLQGALEIGWPLGSSHWRQGYATEAAARWLGYGFEVLGRDEIVAFTAESNAPSRAVMRKLGMVHDPARDFDYPTLPEGHPLRAHVLYALSRRARAGTA